MAYIWGMAVCISSEVAGLLRASAMAAMPQECCGILFGTTSHGAQAYRITDARVTRNVAIEPERCFEIDPAALIDAERAMRNGGAQLLGYYHSHPNGVASPSARDAVASACDGRLWLIVAGDALTAWRNIASGSYHGAFEPLPIKID